ncbi:N-acetylmuramidase family protein [Chitinimonas sp. PSY-7]|uniref:N-acetylmuramidase domain-containing protein n=1 Tax=Chitinimonas sp. PSY-7 TaxID=3459088 RepID=UPI004040016F
MSEAQANTNRDLSIADLRHAAMRLGVTLPAIQAVCEVESRGAGFLQDGRPKILFERHVMYRLLKQAGKNADAYAARYVDVVNPIRGGYVGGAGEHKRFDLAALLDEGCAIGACSWGRFQIMGYHWQRLGYDSAKAFADAMASDERKQLDAFVAFILADEKLLAALRERDWTAFANLYNGPAYRVNRYDTKLASAYAQFSAKVPA